MRAVWVITMLAGVAVFGALGLARFYGLYLLREDSALLAVRALPGAIWGGGFMLAAGACAAGMFMKPHEFRAAMKAPEAPRPAWLDDLARPADADKAGRDSD